MSTATGCLGDIIGVTLPGETPGPGDCTAGRVRPNAMTQQMGDEPRALDRRRFLKRAALGVADALETAARVMGAPGLGSPGPTRDRERLDQPEDGAEDPMFLPARRGTERTGEKRGPDRSIDPGETT